MRKLLVGLAVSVLVVGCVAPSDASPSTPGTGAAPPNSTPQTPHQALTPFRPLVGGHLLVIAGGAKLAMADVEGDRLRVYDVSRVGLDYEVTLPEKSWPTRIAEGHHGELHVLLRGTGQLATVTNDAGTRTLALLDVCAEPRGLVVAADSDVVTVACAGGEIVQVGGGKVIDLRKTAVEWRDLRLTAQGIEGTSFRSAEFVTLAASNATTRVKAPPQRVNTTLGSLSMHEAQVAWRMVSSGSKTFLVHQLHADQISLTSGSGQDAGFPGGNTGTDENPYGSSGPTTPGQVPGCTNAAVVTAITTIENGAVTGVQRSLDVLPVDAAMSPDGSGLAVAGAGGTGLSIYPTAAFAGGGPTCLTPTAGLTGLSLHSVAWLSPTRVAVIESLRTSPMLFDLSTGQTRMFGADLDRASPAHALFHQAPRGGAPLACASCHPEGGEDGHTWVIDGKTRRTQTLSGGVMNRAPFHWQGDLQNLNGLMTDTFVKRMGGTAPGADQVTALGTWLDTIPAPKPSRHLTPEELTAGRAAFNKGQCNSCHLADGTQEGGASDIGTGERVRAPSLSGLFLRAPYLHTGQIPDIRSRVTGTLHPAHGALGNLGAVEREDLIAYLESL